MKRYFDVAVILPLEEEFETALSHFKYIGNLSTEKRIRIEVSADQSDLSVLLVKQNLMGRAESINAALDILEEFEVGMLVCVGIAGGLSSDVSIGDVCRTGEIVDLLDNAKITDAATKRQARGSRTANTPKTNQVISFSPTHYETPIEVTVALDLDKFLPERRKAYEKWAQDGLAFGSK
ncbi:MAG: hypothetical protein AB7I42_01250 [Bradyrhizobium sp.]|uniref:phosphorylase family protein n=1 Tax=Bradyrhizobium sp. TaxID=376 RepID=UPI003D0ABCFC